MTTEEKLQHFQNACMDDAKGRSSRMLDEYRAALEQTFTEHQDDARRRADMQIQLESNKIEREINKTLAIEQLKIKSELGRKKEELKEKLFVELKDMLARFLETPEYSTLLRQQVQHAAEFAGDDEVTIYLDPVDEDKSRKLSLLNSNAHITISEYSFNGGTRAVIPSRHILIDNSFQSKLAETQEDFHFDLSLTGGEN
ncbi:MAG: V-type ATP synthase subunit E [Lachnospiraceae bacterium]